MDVLVISEKYFALALKKGGLSTFEENFFRGKLSAGQVE